MSAIDHADRAVSYEAPLFSAAQAMRDPRREAAELAARRRDAGFDEGYSRGWKAAGDVVNEAIEDHRRSAERLNRCSSVMERAYADLVSRDRLALAEIEPDVVRLAVALAAEILGHEVASIDEPVLDSLARVAQLLPDRGAPVLRVHPDDEATAREAVSADLVRWSSDVVFVADPGIEPGGCVVDIGACRIDGQISAAVERMRNALG